MTSIQLDKELSGHVFAFLFIFCRVTPVIMLMPGFGESYVSPRFRGAVAMTISFLFMGPMLPTIPAPPGDVPGLVKLLGFEMLVGLYFGSMVRLIMSTLETVGFIIAMQTGLSNAVILNPALATQSPLPSAFMSIVGLTLVFVTGLDHFLLRSMAATYELFPPGSILQPGDMAQAYLTAFGRSFRVGIELASPFMVIGILMYVAMGLLQKLMPQVQLFLVMLPIQIWGGLFLMSITIGAIMSLWLHYFDQSINTVFGR
jgi:flagellar biosynthesis protein FliR